MTSIPKEIVTHKLNVDPKAKPVMQKRRPFTPERNADTNAEVDKLLKADTVKEVLYPT